MKRVTVPVCTLLLLGIMGCGTDQRETLIGKVLSIMENTTTQLSQIKKKLKEAVDKEKPFVEADLKDAEAAVKTLKEQVGKELLDVNSKIKASEKKPLSSEQQAEYRKKFASRIESSFAALDTEFREVNQLLDLAEKKNRTATHNIKRLIKEAQADFEAIAKRS